MKLNYYKYVNMVIQKLFITNSDMINILDPTQLDLTKAKNRIKENLKRQFTSILPQAQKKISRFNDRDRGPIRVSQITIFLIQVSMCPLPLYQAVFKLIK